jgi:hypothetical protein
MNSPRRLDLQSKAAYVAVQTSVWFGSLDVLGFRQDPDQRFLLRWQKSDEDIACAIEELTNLFSDCQDRVRPLKDKSVGLGLGDFCAASLRSARKWKKYRKISE